MGIYDREYYRGDSPGFLGSFSGRGQVCKWLIAANVICFFLQIGVKDFTGLFELDPSSIAHGEVWRLLTYAFLHDPSQILHIVFNMLFLWWFGAELEDIYGPREFLGFYLVAALVGGIGYVLWALAKHEVFPCVGASGAVTALMVVYAMHFPRRIIYFMMILPMQIWVFVTLLIVLDTFVLVGGAQSSTAVAVHLAGAAFGFVYYRSSLRIMNLLPDFRRWQLPRSRPRLKVYRGERPQQPVSVAAPPKSEADEQLEAKLDAVLEKVARLGQESLSDSERQILMRASEVFKRRHP